ncbi:hypothetical protein VitviT2T_006001 [Vitis vinifera]|uniref:BAG domain-containing protein n=1 Tax=Vitis vinifera TaxID=29760 RepID=A0ABY9BUQ5_VITVI|nr:hypothetical protein VitviT2T_006001 [Vitis vinifera]
MTSKERKLEEERRSDEISKACKSITEVKAKVDKLLEKVVALEATVNGGTTVEDKEFVVLIELLMRQLLKLDGIEAEGEAKLRILGLSDYSFGSSTHAPIVPSAQSGEDVYSNKVFLNGSDTPLG